MKKSIARREFIRRAGLTVGAWGLGSSIFESIVADFFGRAYAQTTGMPLNPSGYYIHFTMPGGPPRWYFDLPLTPAGKTAANFIEGGFGTHLDKVGADFKSTYVVEKHVVGGKTIYLPPVWNMKLAKQDFTSILPNTVFVRGVDMEINSHALSNSRQTAPIIGGLSLNGVVADGAARPMPCIVDSGSNSAVGFRSQKGLTASSISYAENANVNPASSLLAPFKNYMTGRSVHSAGANRLEEQAFREFEKYAEDRGIAASSIGAAYDNAITLMENDIYKLQEQWTATVAKYRAIIAEALFPKKGDLPGIFDKAVPSKTNGLFTFERGTGDYVTLSDIRDMLAATTKAPQMAENFAVAEILLDKATATMNLAMRPLTGLASGHGNFNSTHDQHFVGAAVSTIITTLFYRAFLGCLTEYVAALKSRGLFDRTVLHVSAEFNRTPKSDGSGADHGYMAGNTTLISGMIKENGVVGNITKASLSDTYKGTFGVAAPYVLDGFNRPIQVNDVARTITSMLGVKDIVTNGRALLAPKDGKWILRKAEAKNV
jgi:hypothetical protein